VTLLLTILLTLLLPILVSLLADELGAWSPSLADRLVHRAIRSLPALQRYWYKQHWDFECERVPGKVTKLVLAVKLAGEVSLLRLRLRLRAWAAEVRYVASWWWTRPRGKVMALSFLAKATRHNHAQNGRVPRSWPLPDHAYAQLDGQVSRPGYETKRFGFISNKLKPTWPRCWMLRRSRASLGATPTPHLA
jgi:hypothetical protein